MSASLPRFGHRFEYDEANDVVCAYPCGRLETPADVDGLYADCVAYYSRFGRKVDVIVTLDMFTMNPVLGERMDRLRTELMARFVRYQVIVDCSGMNAAANASRKARGQEHTLHAPDIQEGVAIIKKLRSEAA